MHHIHGRGHPYQRLQRVAHFAPGKAQQGVSITGPIQFAIRQKSSAPVMGPRVIGLVALASPIDIYLEYVETLAGTNETNLRIKQGTRRILIQT